MSTFEVTIETIKVFPHPNAERLELAQVGLYNIVVGKGTWQTGDKVLYIPEYAVLPENLITALGLEGKLAGSHKNRVKPITLRGELSQGLVAPLTFLPEGAIETIGENGNFAETLGIKKWEPEVPASLSGEVEGSAELIQWIDIENLKKFPDLFEEGEPVFINEKIHGTASCYTFLNPENENPEVLVTSKGLGSKNLVIRESERVVYWNVLKEYRLQELAHHIASVYSVFMGEEDEEGDLASLAEVTRVAVFGETFGSKIQDLHYGMNQGKPGFAVFDIFIEYKDETGTHGYWLNPKEVNVETRVVGVPTVPALYEGPFSLEKVVELASGMEQVSGKELHIREGVVVRPIERKAGYSEGAKKIAKYVSEAYLTRKGLDGQAPTEYN